MRYLGVGTESTTTLRPTTQPLECGRPNSQVKKESANLPAPTLRAISFQPPSDPHKRFLSILSIKRGNWFYCADWAERAERAESKESPVVMRIEAMFLENQRFARIRVVRISPLSTRYNNYLYFNSLALVCFRFPVHVCGGTASQSIANTRFSRKHARHGGECCTLNQKFSPFDSRLYGRTRFPKPQRIRS